MKTMDYRQPHDIEALAVKQVGKWAVSILNGLSYEGHDVEIWKFVIAYVEALYPNKEVSRDYLCSLIHGGMFFFDTEVECYEFYRIFEQPLTDSSAIYACTYGPDGQCQTENT